MLRGLALLAGLAAPLALAGCTGLTPVYGENGLNAQRVEISYAKPDNRLEQIIYQDLALKLGKSPRSENVPRLVVSASEAARDLTSNVVAQPSTPRQITVTARMTLYAADGTVLFTGSRSASADYTAGPQLLAAQQAATDASERAARAVADTVRLQVLSALAR